MEVVWEMSEAPRGYTPEEIERGEDRPGCVVTMNPWGCLLYPALLAALGYCLYRLALAAL